MARWLAGSLGLLVVALACAQSPPRISVDGRGPARIGMTESELSDALGVRVVDPDPGLYDGDCRYVYAKPQPAGTGASAMASDDVGYMLIQDRLARIDVDAASEATLSGARVGMAESALRALYPGRLAEQPHHYGEPGDHYLTLHSSDGRRGIRFETQAGVVTRFYAGTAEAIQYVEGCL
jgi:hypothetical protein